MRTAWNIFHSTIVDIHKCVCVCVCVWRGGGGRIYVQSCSMLLFLQDAQYAHVQNPGAATNM